MPLYCFICPDCDEGVAILREIVNRTAPVVCICGGSMIRDIGGEQGRRDMKEFKVPIEMMSIGMNPDEVPAFQRANPDIEIRAGVPIAHTRQQKLQALKYFGFEEGN